MNKNYIALVLIFLLGNFTSFAQFTVDGIPSLRLPNEQIQQKLYNVPSPATSNAKNKAGRSGWLNPRLLRETQGSFWDGATFSRLFPDSFVNYVGADGALFQPAFHAIGNVFNPTNDFYGAQTINEGGWQINRFDDFDVDSIVIPYVYLRETDSIMTESGTKKEIVDTAFIYYLQNNNLSRFRFDNRANGGFAIPTNLNVALLRPATYTQVDTILLTAENATTTDPANLTIGQLAIEVKEEFRRVDYQLDTAFGGSVVGVEVVFKPGIKYVFGDTIRSFSESIEAPITFNDFGVVTYGNSGANIQDRLVYNNTFVSNRQVRYGQAFGSIRGHLPIIGILGWQRDVYMDVYFHVVEPDGEEWSSVEKVYQKLATSVYPNPTTAGENISVLIKESVNFDEVNINLVDILGNKIAKEAKYVGSSKFDINTTGLANGIYFVNVTSGNKTSTTKIAIND